MISIRHATILLFTCFVCITSQSQSKKAIAICKPIVNTNPTVKLMQNNQKNVFGTDLELASKDPMTGFFRTGFCSTDQNDRGVHVVAAVVSDEFLKYSLSKGNDLISPYPESGFPGLKAGNIWCLCAMRWKESYDAGVAPKVILEATNIKALDYIDLKILKKMAHK